MSVCSWACWLRVCFSQFPIAVREHHDRKQLWKKGLYFSWCLLKRSTMVGNIRKRELAGHILSASRKQTEEETKNLGKVAEPYSPNIMLFPARLHMPKAHCFPKYHHQMIAKCSNTQRDISYSNNPRDNAEDRLVFFFKNLTDPVNQCWVYTWAKEFDNDIILLQRLTILMLSTNWNRR